MTYIGSVFRNLLFQKKPFYYFNALLIGIGAFGLIDWLSEMFNDVLTFLGYYMPYFAPYAIVITIYFCSCRNIKNRLYFSRISQLYSVSILTWLVLSLYQFIYLDINFHPMVVMSNIWVLVFFIAIQNISIGGNHRQVMLRLAFSLILATAIMQIALEVWLYDYLQSYLSTRLFNNNYLAMMMAFGVILIIADLGSLSLKSYIVIPAGFIFLYVIYLEGSRGAMVIAFLIGFIHLAATIYKEKNWRLLVTSLIVIAALAYYNKQTLISQMESVLYGLGVVEYNIESGDAHSIYIRTYTIVKVAKSWTKSPLIGLGTDTLRDENHTIDGYLMHSHILIILFGYGLIGFVPYFLLITYLLWVGTIWKNNNYIYILFLLYALLALDGISPWLAFALYFASSPAVSGKDELLRHD